MDEDDNSHKVRRRSQWVVFAWIWRAYPIFLVLLIWEAVSRFGWVNPVLLPPPTAIMQAIVALVLPNSETGSSVLLEHTAVSLKSVLIGYVAASAVFTALGLLMGMNRRVFNFFNPLVSALLPIPTIALIPVIILWLGLGEKTVIFVVFLASLFPVVYNAAAGVRSIPQKYIWAARIMGARWDQVFFQVVLPGAMPYIVTGQRLALGNSWRALVAAEMLAATGYGLGFMIFQARTFMDTETIYAGIVIISILGLALEKLVWGYVERVTIERWGMARRVR
ncbi:MAG: ABC transporter permease [Rhodospirillaceae bacterium]|nr:ABC transporter permease [Rhodospirillaceae bacterium]